MNPDKQRIAVLRAIGYSVGAAELSPNVGQYLNDIHTPNYPGDLNAIHLACEATVGTLESNTHPHHLATDFVANLKQVVGGVPGCYNHHCATAAQRTEALLKTLGLWTDEA